MDNITLLIFASIPLIAFLYASVGHGGASGYLALMAVTGYTQDVMKPTALLLNLFVSAIAFYHFWKAGYFNKKLFYVFAISSIPLSFIGGRMAVDPQLYKIILGLCLLIATIKIVGIFDSKKNQSEEIKEPKLNLKLGLAIGAVIGFISGLIGIGGGIILSPVILLLGWGNAKQAAAVSALFIWVNSASGLTGQISKGITLGTESWIMVLLAVFGGFFGAYVGSKKLNNIAVRQLLAIVLLFASIKLILL